MEKKMVESMEGVISVSTDIWGESIITMVEKRDFTFDVSIFKDDVAYSVKTESVAAFNAIKKLMNEKHIPIDGESEVLDEDKKPLKQYIGIRKKSEAKKLINALINMPWCYLHIDLN